MVFLYFLLKNYLLKNAFFIESTNAERIA